jgi:hypothetical protein
MSSPLSPGQPPKPNAYSNTYSSGAAPHANTPPGVNGGGPNVNGFTPGPHDTVPLSDAPAISAQPSALNATPSATAAPGRAAWIASLLARRRSPQGDILPFSFSYEVPLVDDVPLAQTPYHAALLAIESHDPARAHALRAFYDRRLLGSLRCLADARAEAEEKLERDLEQARKINGEVETQHKRIEREKEEALRPFVEQVEQSEDALTRAHHAAALAMARCGHPYDPTLPDASGVLRHEREPLEAIAGELDEPWTPGDAEQRLPKNATFALTALTGAVLGLSLGLMGEFYSTDELAARTSVVLGFCAGGIGVATLTGEGIKLFFKAVSERFYRGQSAGRWAPLLVAGVLMAVLIVVIDSYVERSGLMSKVYEAQMMQGLTRPSGAPSPGTLAPGAPTPVPSLTLPPATASSSTPKGIPRSMSSGESAMFFLAGMILSLPLVLCYAWHGYLDGRYHVCRNRLVAEREKRFAARARWLREDPSTQQALDAVSRVREALRHLELVRARMGQAARPFEREMALWEGKRLPEVRELDQSTVYRLQDLLANAHGAQIEWDRALDAARGVPLWHLSFWQRLKLLFGFSPYPARVQKLPRHRS